MSLVEIYDKFRNPEFVMKFGTRLVDGNLETYSIKGTIPTSALGDVTFESLYFVGKSVAIPVMILSGEQLKVLNNNKISIIARERKLLSENPSYICIPSRGEMEKIDLI